MIMAPKINPNKVSTTSLIVFPYLPQMGVLESLFVFEPIAQGPVQGRMGKQDGAHQLAQRYRKVSTDQINGYGHPLMVEEVLSMGTDPVAQEIAQHDHVRGQDEQGKPPPGKIQYTEKVEAQAQHHESLQFAQSLHTSNSL